MSVTDEPLRNAQRHAEGSTCAASFYEVETGTLREVT